MKVNYHTHTARCQHAVGADEDYVRAGLAAGFDVLGFADHAPWPFANGFVSTIRMPLSDFDGYMSSCRQLQQKYAGQIDLRIGLESEYFPRYHDHMLRLREQGVSYFILGHHYADSEEDNPYTGLECRTDDGVRRYADTCCSAMRTGLFCYLAHPDLFMRHRSDDQFNAACMEAADMICQCAIECGMPIEYNLLGLDYMMKGKGRGYPSAPFWQYVRHWNNDVILGVDAHDPAMLADTALWERGRQDILSMGYHFVEHPETLIDKE